MRFEDVPANARWALNGENDTVVAEFGGNKVVFKPGKAESGPVFPLGPTTESMMSWLRPVSRKEAADWLSRDEAASLLSAAAGDTVIAMNSNPQSPKLSPAMKAALEMDRRALAKLAEMKAKGLPLPKVP